MFSAIGFVLSVIYFSNCNAEECKDESAFCNITTIDICSQKIVSKYCLKTCGLCKSDAETSTVIPTEECSDQWTNCTKLEVDGACLNDSDAARIYCYKTCSNCTATTTKEPNLATHFDSCFIIIYCILFFATMKLMA